MRAGDAGRGELRRWVLLSALAHACVLAALAWAPRSSAPAALPGAVMVDLVAMAVPASEPARPAPAPSPARATPLPPEPAPAKPPPQPKPPAPPPPTAEAVLPKTPQREPDKPKPPKPEPKPEPDEAKAKPEPPPPPPKKPPEAPDYDDVLASLRAERGETRPDRATAPPAPAGAAGVPVSPEVASWQRAAQMAVRRAWVLPAGFRKQPLQTHVTVDLDAEGNVLGEPRVTQRSGNPWYDESVARAIQKASPLPRPPEAGAWPFVFCPEERC